MAGLILAVVVLAVVAVVFYRRWQDKRELENFKQEREQKEGHTPEQAWLIYEKAEIDPYVKRERCHCGGRMWMRTLTKLPEQPSIQAAVCECYKCEAVTRLYFEREYLN